MPFFDNDQNKYSNNYLIELNSLIQKHAPDATNFLEWGSGETTNLLCDIARTRKLPMVMSLDDDLKKQTNVAENIANYKFLHFRQLEIESESVIGGDQFLSYSSYPFFLKLDFDVILINGKRRMECLLTATQIVSNGGIVVLSDWRRRRYDIAQNILTTIEEGDNFLILKATGIQKKSTAHSTKEKRVIIVPASGRRAKKEVNVTKYFTKLYAKSTGSDFYVVGEKSKLSPDRIKSEALDIASSYDRLLLLDADVLIRPKSPDIFSIVPKQSLGVFPEGSYFPRKEWCDELNSIYQLKPGMKSYFYFNSGVLVMSNENLFLLEKLRTETIWGHPQFEQGFLNAACSSENIPLFLLPPDFNYMPNISYFPVDWRYAFFLHFAGSGKKQYHYQYLWRDESGDRKSFKRHSFMAADIRLNLLRQASRQVNGRSTYFFDPTDFFYNEQAAVPILSKDDGAVFYFPIISKSLTNQAESPSVWGPYITLDPGMWQLQFKKENGTPFDYRGAKFDIVSDLGSKVIIGKSDWPPNGVLKFNLTEKTKDIEFRIYRAGFSDQLSFIKLKKL
ncbi:hypothetical protein [Desulfovibrio sp. TomC]|uniref:hypothetical protein n=1 Tax=Desulfovibrio sp. TomC TaxID=1562888 RepID=UPI0005744F0A|nr:hypothetical protein [Desulfovibrio sp. TomC]KHK00136.1 hypothetical protein NY78_4451 [Desulfovibrio sp. TomC]